MGEKLRNIREEEFVDGMEVFALFEGRFYKGYLKLNKNPEINSKFNFSFNQEVNRFKLGDRNVKGRYTNNLELFFVEKVGDMKEELMELKRKLEEIVDKAYSDNSYSDDFVENIDDAKRSINYALFELGKKGENKND